MRKNVAGALRLAVLMPGDGCIVRKMTGNAGGGEFCISSIWSTPRNAENHAKQIRRVVDNCIRTNEFHPTGE